MVGVTIVVRAELSVRTFGHGGRAFVPDFRDFRSASPPPHRGFDPARPLLCGETSARRTGNRRAFDRNPSRAPGFCSEISVDHRDFKPKLRRGATETPRRSFAPRQRAGRPGGCAARSKALSAQSTAVSRHACGRPRRGAVAAVLPHWSHDDGRLSDGRLTLQLPPLQTATGAERCANAGTAQRARNGRRAYPANRHHVCTCRRSCVRRLTISIPIGAAFGYDTRTHTLRRTPIGRGPIPAA